MKQFSLFLLGLGLSSITVLYAQSSLIPTQRDGGVGFMDTDSCIVIPPIYEDVTFFGGIYPTASLSGKPSLEHHPLKVLSRNQSQFNNFSQFHRLYPQQLAGVKQDKRWSIIDQNGQVLLPFVAPFPLAIRPVYNDPYFESNTSSYEKRKQRYTLINSLVAAHNPYKTHRALYHLESGKFVTLGFLTPEISTEARLELMSTELIFPYIPVFRCGLLIETRGENTMVLVDTTANVIRTSTLGLKLVGCGWFAERIALNQWTVGTAEAPHHYTVPAASIFSTSKHKLLITCKQPSDHSIPLQPGEERPYAKAQFGLWHLDGYFVLEPNFWWIEETDHTQFRAKSMEDGRIYRYDQHGELIRIEQE